MDFLKFESPEDNYGTVKATVHRSGRLGFSSGAAKMMELNGEKLYKVGFNSEDSQDNCIYLVESNNEDKQAFKVRLAGEYFYMKLKSVFERNSIPYRVGSIIYDIEKIKNNNLDYYKLIPRKKVMKKQE